MMWGKLVVAEGENDQQLSSARPASKILNDVQGGLVGPMQILEHNDCRSSSLQISDQPWCDMARACSLLHECSCAIPDLLGNIVERG
jgi:hypothetical protein